MLLCQDLEPHHCHWSHVFPIQDFTVSHVFPWKAAYVSALAFAARGKNRCKNKNVETTFTHAHTRTHTDTMRCPFSTLVTVDPVAVTWNQDREIKTATRFDLNIQCMGYAGMPTVYSLKSRQHIGFGRALINRSLPHNMWWFWGVFILFVWCQEVQVC